VLRQVGRDFLRAGWILWNLGFVVGEKYWRAPFQKGTATFERLIEEAGEHDGDQSGLPPILSERAIDLVEAASNQRTKTPAVGAIRRRTGRANFQTVLRAVLEVILGIYRSASQLDDENDAKQQTFIWGRTLGTAAATHKKHAVERPSPFQVEATELTKC
jgi:hypothetical protein